MIINSKQLRQIAAICDTLNEVEHNSGLYDNGANDATLINTLIPITERDTNKPLGYVEMGCTSYGFRPSQPIVGQLKKASTDGS